MGGDARYELGAEIGRGALGRVVRVTDGETGEVLAGKILHASNRDDEGAAARFAREAELLRGLAHENVVAVRGIVEVADERVLLMELIDGPSLVRVLAERGALPEARVVAIGRGIAAGLAAAHRAGVVHRDLKPANVLLAPGDVPKIVDFGMAQATSFSGVDTRRFVLVGTPDYMAPESTDPLAIDPRSDLYSLGCILYELLAGRPPYSGASAFALVEAHRRAPVPQVAGSPALAQLVRALLAKSPADRPQSAAAVAETLRGAMALEPAVAAPLAAGGSCYACRAPLVAGVAICFECGAAPLTLASGPMTVYVTGPGAIASKLDSELRFRLIAWLRANPQLGLDPTPLERKGPRLPFVVATKLDEEAAGRLCAALKALHLVAIAAHRKIDAMAAKSKLIAQRRGAIGAGVAWPIIQAMTHLHDTWAMLLIVPALLAPVVAAIEGYIQAARPVTLSAGDRAAALPPSLAGSVAGVVESVPAIEARRHREGLRAVVQRVLALRERAGSAALDADLAQVLDLATAAAVRIDELERRLTGAELRETDATTRRLLKERDACAARLLDAAAQLDALRARWAAAGARGTAGEVDAALAGLRAEVEAFEEVQELTS